MTSETELLSYKVPKLRPFLLLARETCGWVLNIGDNTVARKIRCTRRKTCPIDTMSTTNPTWTGLGSNPGLGGDRPATDRLSLKSGMYYFRIQLVPRSKHIPSQL